MEYNDKVMDHFMNPRNVGDFPEGEDIGTGTVGNERCGDIMRVFLRVEGDVIVDAKFKTFGCGAAVATSSIATEMVIGKTLQEAAQITNKAVTEALEGLPAAKAHCSVLAEEALHAALWNYAQKHGLVIDGVKPPIDESERAH
ncbi:MAG: iron-sulfur cluster assembly scaffold protein [Defluviitaleaceae bacterium]|nr:iron-sulfur cluster assembly scaffold protein [Defluviitaleaceae bacterium]